MDSATLSCIGLAGLAVMGQNLALNVAEKGFPISVYNRTASKVDDTLVRAKDEGNLPLTGHYNPKDFILSIKRPRSVVLLVKAGAPVDQTIATLSEYLEPGDAIIDGGNEWYENTEKRIREAESRGILYLGMGVSGGEEGARNGPSLMPGGSHEAYKNVEHILKKVAAQVNDGPCVTYIGAGGAGNFVKMVHNGIEYGDMQLISEAYDVLKTVGGLSNEDLAGIFHEWNRGELESFLIEITSDIFKVKDGSGSDDLVNENNIQIIAYSPLGANGAPWGTIDVMNCPTLKNIALAKEKSLPQICLRWLFEQGVTIVVKSYNKDRMKENLQIFDWELTEEDNHKISKIPQKRGCPGDMFVSPNGPYKSIEQLWDGEI